MERKKTFIIVCMAMLFLAGCVWGKKSAEDEALRGKHKQTQARNVQEDGRDIPVTEETTTEYKEMREPVTDVSYRENNSFSDIEYGEYSSVTPKLTDFIMGESCFKICFEDSFQALVSYDEAQGRLQIHLPGCRSSEFELPGFYKNDYFSELVIAGSEEGIDVLAYLNRKWYGRIKFEFEEFYKREYNIFRTDIIVLE